MVSSHAFTRMAVDEIRELHGLHYRHDLEGQDGKSQRGWKGLVIEVGAEVVAE